MGFKEKERKSHSYRTRVIMYESMNDRKNMSDRERIDVRQGNNECRTGKEWMSGREGMNDRQVAKMNEWLVARMNK